ncbi:hypothetical protein RGQ29_006910 [Quercus rubra]|uniref:Uncharacterized protein n=1 Tax=Quercus rubra TaxID=3512 RepID=A0AAN7E9I9_QUERU|nr:hypothetical protein RGQ29_006910 [Quercus rubra]
MAEILSPPISPILLLARRRQYCEHRFVKMYWQCMRRRRRKRHHCQNRIWNGMVRKDFQHAVLNHSNLQLMHSIFYGSDDRKRFLDIVIYLKAAMY